MKGGVGKSLVDMIISTNECFDTMVGQEFPRREKIVVRPFHATMGTMEICDGGLLSLGEADVGTAKIFYDMDEAERQGYFGTDPKIWGDKEYDELIELLTAGLSTNAVDWDNFRYHPTVRWTEDNGAVQPAQKKAMTQLADKMRNKSPLLASALRMPIIPAGGFFNPSDALSIADEEETNSLVNLAKHILERAPKAKHEPWANGLPSIREIFEARKKETPSEASTAGSNVRTKGKNAARNATKRVAKQKARTKAKIHAGLAQSD
jgi:hypothetical protein